MSHQLETQENEFHVRHCACRLHFTLHPHWQSQLSKAQSVPQCANQRGLFTQPLLCFMAFVSTVSTRLI